MQVITINHIVNNNEVRCKASISEICEYFQIPLTKHKNEISPQYAKRMGPIIPGIRR